MLKSVPFKRALNQASRDWSLLTQFYRRLGCLRLPFNFSRTVYHLQGSNDWQVPSKSNTLIVMKLQKDWNTYYRKRNEKWNLHISFPLHLLCLLSPCLQCLTSPEIVSNTFSTFLFLVQPCLLEVLAISQIL